MWLWLLTLLRPNLKCPRPSKALYHPSSPPSTEVYCRHLPELLFASVINVCVNNIFSRLIPIVVKKISTSEDVVAPPASASNAHSPATRGTKRSCEDDEEANNSEYAWFHNLDRKNVEPEVWQEQTENRTPAPNRNTDNQLEFIQSPQSKRRVSVNSLLLDDNDRLGAWSQDPLFTFSEYSQAESNPIEQNNSTAKDLSPSESCFFNSQSEEQWDVHLDVAAKTSTQKSLKHSYSSLPDDDKENKFALFTSPNKHLTYSSYRKCTAPPSPTKYVSAHPQGKVESQFTRPKPRSSPIKRAHLSCKVVDEDSLSMLFTQDSEGFRVIAHGNTPGRDPLKDQSNTNAGMSRMSAHKSMLEEEMLFTQDSQGNLVIKH